MPATNGPGTAIIALFTDFGRAGPYLGQMTAVLVREAPGVPVVSLLSDARRRSWT